MAASRAARSAYASREHPRRHVARPRELERSRAGLVGGDGDDLRLPAVDRVEQRLEVRARAGGEDADAKWLAHTAAVSPIRSVGYAPPVSRRRPSVTRPSMRVMTSSARRWAKAP